MQKALRLLTLSLLLALAAACGNMTSGEHYAAREALPTSAPVVHSISVEAPEPIVGERYSEFTENPFVDVEKGAISTFSIDADGGSYANVRRFLQQGRMLPPPEAVRTEEFINYFPLNYPFEDQGHPIALNGEISTCPWQKDHRLVRIGIQGKPLAPAEVPRSNYVFLVDVSGSMDARGKLDLLKAGMHRFVDAMSPEDYLSIVTYASRTGVHLESTAGSDKQAIRASIDALEAGGGTNGGAGIQLAYEQAEKNFISNGNNRILLGTDGDFNVGMTNHEELITLIENKRKDGVFITVLGVGSGNYNEATMEQLANKGNGTYEYLDKLAQLEKVFFGERGKFFTVAKDVKVQVEFNPEQVAEYRLIGYENRMLNTEDFTDDAKDAGEIGAGQSITALYEIVPRRKNDSGEALKVLFRYKDPNSDGSLPLSLAIPSQAVDFSTASERHRFVTGVAGFSLLLRQSEYSGNLDYPAVRKILQTAHLPEGGDLHQELIELVSQAEQLTKSSR